jgi:hypothetical protein
MSRRPPEYSIRLKKLSQSFSEPAKWEASVVGYPALGNYVGATPAEAMQEAVTVATFMSEADLLEDPPGNSAADEGRAAADEPAGPGRNRGVRRSGGAESRSRAGYLHLRMPKALHDRLSVQSRRQGVSLNQYATYLLATAIESESRAPGEQVATLSGERGVTPAENGWPPE